MLDRDDIDVLVAGGGPAGLATAAAAAAEGLRVVVVHRDAAIGRPVRTSGASWGREIARLGIPSHLAHPVPRVVFESPHERAEWSFREDGAVVLDVTGTFEHLAELARRAGADVHCAHRFVALDVPRAPGPFTATVEDGAGERHRVRARLVVDATGPARSVLRAAGLAAAFTRVGAGAEVEHDDTSTRRDAAVLFVGGIAPSGYGWLFPTPARTVRVGLGVIRPDAGDASPGRMLRTYLDHDGPARHGITLGPLRERHGGVTPSEGLARRFVFGRIVAVGDSVGQVLPTVGEGIRYAIESGRIAGASIAAALRAPSDEIADRALAGYEDWWRTRHRRAFARAQAVNVRLARLRDADWDRGTRVLAKLPPEIAGRLLRMTLRPGDLVRIALASPRALFRLGEAMLARDGA